MFVARTALALLLFALHCGVAFAQPGAQDKQRARLLFTEGGELLSARDYGAAEQRFREGLELYPHPPIAFNLAITLEKQGRFLEALEVLDRGLRAEFGELDAAQQEQYTARTAEMRRLLAELTVSVRAPGTLVIDGRAHGEIDEGEAKEISLDPGAHLVVVEFEQGRVERSVRLATSGREKLMVEPPPRIDGIGQQGDESPVKVDDDGGAVFESPWFWVGTVAVIGGAVATFFVVRGASDGGLETDPVWGVSETLTGP